MSRWFGAKSPGCLAFFGSPGWLRVRRQRDDLHAAGGHHRRPPRGERRSAAWPMFVTRSRTWTRVPFSSSRSSITFWTPYGSSGGGVNRAAKSPSFVWATGPVVREVGAGQVFGGEPEPQPAADLPVLLAGPAHLLVVVLHHVEPAGLAVGDDPRADVQGDDQLGRLVGDAEVVLPAAVLDRLDHGGSRWVTAMVYGRESPRPSVPLGFRRYRASFGARACSSPRTTVPSASGTRTRFGPDRHGGRREGVAAGQPELVAGLLTGRACRPRGRRRRGRSAGCRLPSITGRPVEALSGAGPTHSGLSASGDSQTNRPSTV